MLDQAFEISPPISNPRTNSLALNPAVEATRTG